MWGDAGQWQSHSAGVGGAGQDRGEADKRVAPAATSGTRGLQSAGKAVQKGAIAEARGGRAAGGA